MTVPETKPPAEPGTPNPAAPPTPPEPPQSADTGLSDEVDKWKALARKHEDQAKANADAAKRLAEIEDANKSEADKLSTQLTAIGEERDNAVTELARLRAALKHGLDLDDLDLLGTGSEDEIEQRAKRLAARIGDATKPRKPAADANQGRGGDQTISTAQQFAAAIEAAL